MRKAELIQLISYKTGFKQDDIKLVITTMTEEIKNQVVKGNTVFMSGFGSFLAKTRKARTCRDITRNKPIHVPEHRTASFRASKEFEKLLK